MSIADTQSEVRSSRPPIAALSSSNLPPPVPAPREEHTAVQDLSTVVMPGSAVSVAEEIHDVSPEGSPGDPKAGPARLLSWLGGLVALVFVVALATGIWINWATAGVVVALGCLALVFNPLVLATLMRAGDRKEVLEHRRQNDPPQHPERSSSPQPQSAVRIDS